MSEPAASRRRGMGLQLRILLVFGALWLVFIVLIGHVGGRRIMDEFLRLEEGKMIERSRRVEKSLLERINQLDLTTRDWATWDDAHDFIETRCPVFVHANLRETSLANIEADFMAFHRGRDGRIVARIAADRASLRASPFPAEIARQLESGAILAGPAVTGEPLKGLLLVDGRPAMVASWPITRSDRSGPIRGALVIGRFIDDVLMEELSEQLDYECALLALDSESTTKATPALDGEQSGRARLTLLRRDPERFATRLSFTDLLGRPGLEISMTVPREFHRVTIRNIRLFQLSLVLEGLMAGIFLMFLLNRLVLARFHRLGEVIGRIAAGDGRKTVPEKGNDELTDLARRFNHLLTALDFNLAVARENEERFRAVATSAQDAIIMINGAGLATFWNLAAERIFGFTAEETLGRSIHDTLVPPNFAARYLAVFSRWSATGESPSRDRTIELQALRKSGEEFPIEVSIASLQFGDGRQLVMIGRDLTERKKYEARLSLAKKTEMIGILAGGMAHEFNNQLAVINASLEDFESDDPAARAEAMAGIREAAIEAGTLTRQLLAMGRRQVMTLEITDLNPLLRRMTRLLRQLFGDRIAVTFRLTAELERIRVDRTQFQQALLNLVLNARDAMPRGGTFEITLTDTGHGIAKEISTHLFEPFFSTKIGGEGSGLGLAIVLGIVEQSGGRIWIKSEVGEGTTVGIVFPAITDETAAADDAASVRAADEMPASAPKSPAGADPGGAAHQTDGITILLAEDEAGLRRAVGRVLERAGYRVIAAASGEEALAKFAAAERIDLLLTDVMMPGIGGFELADRLTAFRPELPTLYLSGHVDQLDRAAGRLTPENFLGKPFEIAALLERIKSRLEAGAVDV